MALEGLKHWARRLKTELMALYLACRDPRVPWYGRVLAICVVAYAFSPIDLIPDFIPILGYLDDLILLPIGIWLVLKIIPSTVMQECRQQAQGLNRSDRPQSWVAAGVIVGAWVAVVVGVGWAIAKTAQKRVG